LHAHTLPHTRPCLSSSALTLAGSMWDGSSIGISTDSNPHFLNVGNSLVEAVVNGDVNRNVLIPSLIVGAHCRDRAGIFNAMHLTLRWSYHLIEWTTQGVPCLRSTSNASSRARS